MIRGPITASRRAGPPVFEIEPGPDRFGAIEVTTRPELFDRAAQGDERRAGNFYATWSASPLLLGGTYALPEAIWDQLKAADRLYYRLWTAAGRTAWIDPQVTTRDAEAGTAPFVEVTNNGGGPVVPTATDEIDVDGRRLVLECFLWRNFRGPAPGPEGSPLMVVVRVSAVDAAPMAPALDATRLWVVHGPDVWETPLSAEPRPPLPPHQFERVARNGPRWGTESGPEILVDVVARVVAGDGLGRHLQRRRQPIVRTA